MEQELEIPERRDVDERAARHHSNPDQAWYTSDDGRVTAWHAVCSFLNEVDPHWTHGRGTGIEAALTALYRLKDRADAQDKS